MIRWWRVGGKVAGWGLVCLSGVATSTALADGEPSWVMRAGPVVVSVAPRPQGVRIEYDGVEVVKRSELVVTTPPWAPHYYLGPSVEALAGATRESADGAERLRIVHLGEHGAFEGVETIVVHPDGRVEQTLHAHFRKPGAEALIQWTAGALNPAVIVGRPFRAVLKNGRRVAGAVPVTGQPSGAAAATLAKGFLELEFEARIGRVRIEVTADGDLVCYDYRRDRWANPDDPIFWFGDLGTRVIAGGSVDYRIVYEFAPLPPEPAAIPPARADAVIHPVEHAQTRASDEAPVLVPRPKEVALGEGHAVIRDLARFEVEALEHAADGPAHRAVQAVLRNWRALLGEAAVGADRAELPPAPRLRIEPLPDDAALPAEGYELIVEPSAITLRAADVRGYLYAAQTLGQLSEVTARNAIRVRGARIRDWPSLKFRGVHLFTGGRGPALHEALLRRVIGALKMNALVLEAEYIKWDSHPEIHHAEFGMAKEDVRKILAVCGEYDLEVIPLVMSLGHCQWMFENGQNLDLAEDPEARWMYCVTNPKTYDFIFEVYAEALELFQPRVFHIGHDEFTHRGRVPFRPESVKYTAEQILVMDTLRLHRWLADRGVRTMMWGDMLLGPGEAPDACHAGSVESARALRAEIPGDVVIADWHYVANPPEGYTSLSKFHESGLETVAATWNRPENIVHFAKAAWAQKSRGLLQTTWAGYSLDPASFARELPQYAAYVLAAEAAWNAERPPDPATYPGGSYFLDFMGLSALKPANRRGWTADLSAACNYGLAAADSGGWFGLGPDYDLSAVPRGEVRLKGVAFHIAGTADKSAPSAVVVGGKLSRELELPAAVEIGVGRPAGQLILLHTTDFACRAGTKVGTYVVTYDDGQTAAIDAVYGNNVLAYNDLTAAAGAPIVWAGRSAGGEGAALRALVWDNPHPERVIRTLAVRSAAGPAALVLVGLTGLEGP